MCSHFGLNLHPDHPPAEIESRVYYFFVRWLFRIRLALYSRRTRKIV